MTFHTTFLEKFSHYFGPQINRIRWYGKFMYSVCTYAQSPYVLRYIVIGYFRPLHPFSVLCQFLAYICTVTVLCR